MHVIGKTMWSTLWRDGALLSDLGRVEYYNFNFQKFFPEQFILYKGDRINTHCIYQNPNSVAVPFGLSSTQEMCIHYLMYYPKQSGASGFDVCGNLGGGYTGCASYSGGNPTVGSLISDPVGGATIIFGGPNEDYICPVAATTAAQQTTVPFTTVLEFTTNLQFTTGSTTMEQTTNQQTTNQQTTSLQSTAALKDTIGSASFVKVSLLLSIFVVLFLILV